MNKKEPCILTNMCMIYDGNRILVEDRQKPDWPGIAFPGGHVERNEPFVDSVIREVKEETGLDIENVQLCGIKQWSEKDYRYIVFLYKTKSFKGQLRSSEEGRVFWINLEDIDKYSLAYGFKKVLEVFLNENFCENYSYFEGGSWHHINK